MIDSEVRSYEISSKDDKLLESNREIWKALNLGQTDNALFFPAPNALVPLKFAKFMNKRRVTFLDANEINVSTLIKLAAQEKLSNITVKLATNSARFPLSDNSFDLVYSDWGLSSSFEPQGSKVGYSENLVHELVRVLKPAGKIAALEENGAPVMYPCPPEIVRIRTKMDSQRADRLIMGRRVFGFFKSCKLTGINLKGYSHFLTSDDRERMNDELNRRIQLVESSSQFYSGIGVTAQEQEKYKSWLKSQLSNEPFFIQFNSILTIAEK